jgi:predicted transcriptional regulator
MATNMIQRFEQFDPSTVVLSKMRKNKNGGKTVYINAQNNKKLYLQLPFMRSPFGLSAFTDEATNKTSYSLDLSFDKDNEAATDLLQKLTALDAKIVETVAANSKEWLGKPYNIDVIKEALYKPLVRPGKDEYPSTIKLKVMTNSNGEFIPEAYNMSQEKISVDSIEKGQKCMCIVDFNQIWFIDNKFGVSLRVSQVLCEQSAKLPSFAFQGVETLAPASDDDDCEIDE